MKALHLAGAAVAGIVSGGIAVAAIEWISSLMHPMPDGLTLDDQEGMATFVSSLPASAFLMVLLAWAVGNLVAGYVARRLAPEQRLRSALIACAFLFAASVFTLISLPHPTWFWIAGLATCPIFGLIGMLLASPRDCNVQTTRRIAAPVEKVFRTLATIDEFSKAVPGIVKIEFLTEQKSGVGTKFRETRIMNGKEASTELEVTELDENRHIRMVSDAGGTIWDTIFTVEQQGAATEMKMKMDARPYQTAAKMMIPLIMGIVSRAVEQDMDSVKKFCEETESK